MLNIPWILCPINFSHFNALINMEKCIGLLCANVFFIDNNIGIYWSKQDGTKKKPIMQFNDEHTKICLEHSSQATASLFWAQKKTKQKKRCYNRFALTPLLTRLTDSSTSFPSLVVNAIGQHNVFWNPINRALTALPLWSCWLTLLYKWSWIEWTHHNSRLMPLLFPFSAAQHWGDNLEFQLRIVRSLKQKCNTVVA